MEDYIMLSDYEEKEREAKRLIQARNRAASCIRDAKTRYVKEKTRAKSRKAALEKDAMLSQPRFKPLEAYGKKEDIAEDYGWGCITEGRRSKLEALWDEREALRNSSDEDGVYRDLVTEILDDACRLAQMAFGDEVEAFENLKIAFRKQKKKLDEERFRAYEDYKAWKNGWGKYAPQKEEDA